MNRGDIKGEVLSEALPVNMAISPPNQQAALSPASWDFGTRELDVSPLRRGMPALGMQIDPYMSSWVQPGLDAGSSLSEARLPELNGPPIINPLLSYDSLDPAGFDDSHWQLHSKNTNGPSAQAARRVTWHGLSKADAPSLGQSGKTKCDDIVWDKKAQHALNERKYRESINAKIRQLSEALQRCSRSAHPNLGDEGIGLGTLSKVDVLANAAAYIDEAEINLRHMEREKKCLEARIQELECLLQRET